jgi:basic amino acid/polyamine antiporter, APA family
MQPLRQLSLFDSICIIVGIIIGAGIYETSPLVASCMGGPGGTLAVWLAGGLLAFSGSLCYAELATAYPRAGGDYVYLTRAFGRLTGAMFGWSQLAIVRPGDIALMAFVFARYANQLWAPFGTDKVGVARGMALWAALLVAVLTVINILGVRSGRTTQNILTVAKIVGLLAIVSAAFWGGAAQAPAPTSQPASSGINLQLALILVLFVYGGWNEMAYVAAEVRNPGRNIVRALIFGTLAVVGLYVLISAAFLFGLGYDAMCKSQAIAVDAVTKSLPSLPAGRIIAVVICISAAGAVNGLIFTGARITYALGTEHAMFGRLGRWHPRLGTPVTALAVQGAIALAIVLVAGSFVDTILYSAPVVWLFFTYTALSVFILRFREPQIERPYKVPFFAIVPVIFLTCCYFMLFNSVTYAWNTKREALFVMLGVLALGIPVYFLSRWLESRRAPPAPTAA